MRAIPPTRTRPAETGGVTILVALMMLVFITITALGLSRNSFRQVVISGTARQGAMARNTADSGIEWSIYWMDYANSASAVNSAANLNAMKVALLQNNAISGTAYDIMSSATTPVVYVPGANTAVTLPAVTTTGGTAVTQAFTAGLTRMGKLPITDMSQGVGSGVFAPAQGGESLQAPDLWAIRTDAQVTVAGVTFVHAKETWITTPVQ